VQIISIDDRETLAQNLGLVRRAIWHDMLVSTAQAFGNFDFSLVQVAALYMLDEEGEPTIKQVAEALGRSISATSRLLDQLVERGLIGRREDKQDRRARRVFLTEQGQTFCAHLSRIGPMRNWLSWCISHQRNKRRWPKL